MSDDMRTDEDRLESLLRSLAAELDPAPDLVMAAAKAAWELRDLDTRLATLVADSWRDEPALATRDRAGTLRMLTFTSDGASIEVDVEVDPVTGARRLRGLVTGTEGDLVVERGASRITVPVVDGQFDVEHLPPGPARLSVVDLDGARIVTTWVSI
jgi:hypothetical protein